jgi:hypothetical protein
MWPNNRFGSGVTSAMAAGIAHRVWRLDELLVREEEGAACPIIKPERALMRTSS